MFVTLQEWKTWIQGCIRSGQRRMNEIKQAEKETSGLMQYRLSVAYRMLYDWFRYQDRNLTAQDFYGSLRSYLLVWNTEIFLPDFTINSDNLYGLFQNKETGDIYVNYHTPDYLNEYFLKTAYMQGIPETDTKIPPYELRTNPFIEALTGFSHYKSIEQKLAVAGALRCPDGFTTLIAMLTGGGKSLVMQTIAYQKQEGLTIVIVPTISLMMNQEQNAKAMIHSDVENEIFSYYSQKDLTPFYHALERKQARILFVSPEALIRNHTLRDKIIQANQMQYIKNLVIDEAHIVIEWGASFRVDYQCLDSFQKSLLHDNPQMRTFLMSATYSNDTVQQLQHFYSSNNRWIEIRCDRLRREMRYCIIKATSYSDRLHKLQELVSILPRPMIIYVNAPDTAERVQKHLKTFGITNTRTFTGTTPNQERERLIQQWAEQKFDIMIATCAFGVGVDKKDVRTVLHLYVPENPNKYYQEAGRGGRDGLPCLSVVLYTDEDTDKAFKRMQKVLTTDKLSGRWFSMLQSNKTIRKVGEILIDTSVKPSYNDTDGFFSDVSDIDISWNVYVLLLLRRNSLIDILDVIYEDKRYLFKIRILEHLINTPSQDAISRFEEIRTEEWNQIYMEYEQMRKSLRRAGKECWSEMFNEVYHLTEAYCSGCNAHDEIINEETRKFPLLQELPIFPQNCSDAISGLMDNAEELLILAEKSGQEKLILKLLQLGINSMVFPAESQLPDIILQCRDVKSDCLLMTVQEFFDFSQKGKYYLTGSILIFFPEDEYSIMKLMETARKVQRTCQTKVILIAETDLKLSRRNKYLSELVNGICKQAYLILKGDNDVSRKS